jgi:serine/threonine protein kinase
MEYVEGKTLTQFLAENQHPLQEQLITQIFFQLVSAIVFCHSQNIIHKNIQFDNILITPTFNVIIGDFCLSNSLIQNQSPLTFENLKKFLAPEILSHQNYSFPADVWSLGCVLFKLMTFQNPFGDTVDDIRTNIEKGNMKQITFSFSDSLKSLVQTMLISDPFFRISLNKIAKQEIIILLQQENKQLQLRNNEIIFQTQQFRKDNAKERTTCRGLKSQIQPLKKSIESNDKKIKENEIKFNKLIKEKEELQKKTQNALNLVPSRHHLQFEIEQLQAQKEEAENVFNKLVQDNLAQEQEIQLVHKFRNENAQFQKEYQEMSNCFNKLKTEYDQNKKKIQEKNRI